MLSTPIDAARSSWDLPIPKAMSLATGAAPLLDQIAYQQTSRPVYLTPWQWAEPLCPIHIGITRSDQVSDVRLKHIPFRLSCIREMEAVGSGEVKLTPVYEHITAALSKNLGEFSAGRFFCLPGTLDTSALVNITSYLSHLAHPVRDEAPMVRCALMNELVVSSNNIKRLTQLPTRVGPSLVLDSVKRRVVGDGDGTPDGVIGCVDLGTCTRILGGSYILDGS
ncbi:hypothetical protein HPB50_022471 [Hyalomma asiaticum]|uniref:Uncharacterized protein n=1 Tax=Hyalomma asiaticum TaxID=266040 RepID=A0ACB7RWC6_HYAAI|nr:hypothetical protein HPB50_022471 [Hyalomma asiaticum]